MNKSKRGYICIIGGGRGYNEEKTGINDWTADVFKWIVEKSGFGKIVILDRFDDEIVDLYLKIFKELGGSDQSCKVCAADPEQANNPVLYENLRTANAVYIIGGDQWRHLINWRGTLIEKALNEIYDNGGVISGSSSGSHLLSEYIFDSRNSPDFGGGIFWSDNSILNPYNPAHTYTDDFFGPLKDAVVDTHTTERARVGRLAASVARIWTDYKRDVQGVAIDKFTAIAIDPDLVGEVIGTGEVILINRNWNSYIRCKPNKSLLCTNFTYHQITNGFKYDFKTRKVIHVPDYATTNPPLEEPPTKYKKGYYDGYFYKMTAKRGDIFIDGPVFKDKDAWMNGKLELKKGRGTLPGTIIASRMYSVDTRLNKDIKWTWSNLQSGVVWALAENPGKLGIFVPASIELYISKGGMLYPDSVKKNDIPCVILLDSSQISACGTYKHIRGGVSGAIVNANLHIIDSNFRYDLIYREVLQIYDPDEEAPNEEVQDLIGGSDSFDEDPGTLRD